MTSPQGWDELVARVAPLTSGRCLHCGGPPIVSTVDGYRCAKHPPVANEFKVPVFREPRRSDTVSRGPDGNIRLIDSDGRMVEPSDWAMRDGWGLHAINWARAR